MRNTIQNLFVVGLLMTVLMCGLAWAGHDMPGESPAVKATDTATASVVEKTMRNYIDKDVNLKGSFLIQDPKTNEVWSLQLDKLHPIETIDGAHYFACADFKGRKAGQDAASPQHTLDVDFFVNKEGQSWDVAMIELHKEDGVVRDRPYTCSMHKAILSASPGKKCPVCGMALEK